MSEDEILDLVSEDDLTVLDTITRTHLYTKGASNFRVVNALIVNDKKQICVPRRAASKKLFPLALDTSIGGHVKSGESYLKAFIRESIEEANLDPRDLSFKLLMKLTPHKHAVSAFMHVYLIHYNQKISYNPLDFKTYYWLSPQEIFQKIEDGDSAKSDLTKIITEYLKHEN